MVPLVFALMMLAADPAPPAKPLPMATQAALRTAEATGMAIFLHDQAASVGTDAALLVPGFRQDRRVHGWITEAHGDDITVTFIGGAADQAPAALYRATVSRQGRLVGKVTVHATPLPLSEAQARAAAARTTAIGTAFPHCSQKVNTVVVPTSDNGSDGWSVFILPATTEAGKVPLGGTYRVDTDRSGQVILAQRSYTRSCLVMELGDNAVAMVVTHLLDPMPTPAHVFWSLWAGHPLIVTTPPDGALWSITDGKISPMAATD